jgi:hypothetical protein
VSISINGGEDCVYQISVYLQNVRLRFLSGRDIIPGLRCRLCHRAGSALTLS